jgi:hypothetical protein
MCVRCGRDAVGGPAVTDSRLRHICVVPLQIIQALSRDAAKVDFDRRNSPSWLSLASRFAAVREALAARRERRAPARSAAQLPAETVGHRSSATAFDDVPLMAFAGAFLGCLMALDLTALGLVPCVASASAAALLCGELLVTRTTGLVADAFFPALYGGTFGGMTPVLRLIGGASDHTVVVTCALFLSLSVVCGLAFFVVALLDARSAVPIGSGYGGRSGAIATVASFLFVQLVGLLGADAGHLLGRAGAIGLEPRAAAIGFLACLGGIVATSLAMRHRLAASAGVAVRTFIASAVALVGMTALCVSDHGDEATLDFYYAGCFLGMSTPDRIRGWLQPVVAAYVLTSLLVVVRAFLPGIGGGLGLAAFVTVALLMAYSRLSLDDRGARGH